MNFDVANRWLYGGKLTEDEKQLGFTKSVKGELTSFNDIPVLNKEQYRAGIHLMHHQIFNKNGLAIILYCRNSFDVGTEQAKGTVSCIKFVGTKRIDRGKYSSAISEEDKDKRVSCEIKLDDAANIYRLISGKITHHKIEVIKPKATKKEISFHNSEKGIYAELLSGEVHLNISIPLADSIEIQCIIIALFKIKYPWISEDLMHKLITDRQGYSIKTNEDSFTHSSFNHNHQNTTDTGAEEIDFGLNEPPITDRQKKALWAIGQNKWPGKCDITLKEMQLKVGEHAADTIIKAGNRGDFRHFNLAKNLVRSGNF
jgi:hypothetical protein